jgi:hypothetical protein
VLPGSYNVALVVDGSRSRPNRARRRRPGRLVDQAQRKQLYDMAIEMHEQKRTTEAAGLASLNRRSRNLHRPRRRPTADVKSAFDSLKADATRWRSSCLLPLPEVVAVVAVAAAAAAATNRPPSLPRSARPRTA